MTTLGRMARMLPAALALAAALFASAPAQAAVNTSFSGGTLTITMSASGDVATVKVGNAAGTGGKEILVNGVVQDTNLRTTAKVDSISFQDNSGNGNTTAVIDLTGGDFAPGQNNEAGTSDEIEFFAALGAGTDDLIIRGADGGDRIVMGSAGINLNPEERDDPATGGVDADIVASSLTNVEVVKYEGGSGVDIVSAAGGPAEVGTTPFTIALRLEGNGGDDELTGGNGGDTVSGGDGEDKLLGGSGDDTISGGTGNDRLEGQNGNDQLDGQAGDDTHSGGDGNDTVQNSLGNDLIDGGAHTTFITSDVLSNVNLYADGTVQQGLTIDLAATGPQDTGGGGIDVIVNMEDILGSPFDDVLRGSEEANLITGADGNDFVGTRGGADRLFGGQGSDTLDPGVDNLQDTVSGDDGNDTVSYATRSTPIQVTLADGVDGAGGSGETADVLKLLENITGGSGGDTLTGNSAANVINGGPGQDQLQGGGGNDTLLARDAGADALNCGSGQDSFDADGIDDVGPSCERPYSLPGDGLPPAGLKAPALRWKIARSVKVRKGFIGFRATCPRQSINRCRGTATLLLKRKSIALTRFEIPLGATRTVRLKLSKPARRQLARSKRLKASLRVTSRDDGGAAPGKTLKLTLRR
jgi:Ca2+-binding RTX toxin-like protein